MGNFDWFKNILKYLAIVMLAGLIALFVFVVWVLFAPELPEYQPYIPTHTKAEILEKLQERSLPLNTTVEITENELRFQWGNRWYKL